jgi:sporulation protein YabP
MELTGIEEVESFGEEQITLRTELGMIAVDGHGLKIESFSTENGELIIVGEFDSFYYYGKKESGEKRGLFGRFFK